MPGIISDGDNQMITVWLRRGRSDAVSQPLHCVLHEFPDFLKRVTI